MQAEQVDIHYASNQKMAALKTKRSPICITLEFLKLCSKLLQHQIKLVPIYMPIVHHERLTFVDELFQVFYLQFTRTVDSSGSLEPQARARYEMMMVDSPPVYVNQTHICREKKIPK